MKKSIEVDVYKCSYCGYEDIQLTQARGQDGSVRYLCGECMIKCFDRALMPKKALKNEVKPKRDKAVVKDGGTAQTFN